MAKVSCRAGDGKSGWALRGRFEVSFYYRQARSGAHEQSTLMPVPIQAELDTGGGRGIIDGSLGTWYGGRI